MTSSSSAKTLVKTILKTPQTLKTKFQAKQLHAQFLKTQPHSPSSTSILISIYTNFNLLQDSLFLFNSLSPPPLPAWKSIIKCYANSGLFLNCLTCFIQMRGFGICPDHKMFPFVLKACVFLKNLRLGESIHGCIIRLGWDFDLFTGNALLNMYAKFQSLEVNGGYKVFTFNMLDGMPKSDELCERLAQEKGKSVIQLDSVTKVFKMMPQRDVVSWNTVIAGNAQNGMYEEALKMVREMGNANVKPDSFTLSTILPIFAEYADIMKGKEIHGYAIRHRFDSDLYIGSSLIDMYANCAQIEDSCHVFNLLPQRDDISWNSIIAGCVQNGMFDEGLKLFRQMLMAKVTPREVSFSSVMPACAYLTTLHLGKQLHGYIIRGRFDDNVFIASSLVDMYAKCGNIKAARWIFDQMEHHDMVSWTAIIMGHALHGHAYDALSLFEQMEKDGVKPNYVSFIAVFTACSHAGLTDEAWKHFKRMSQNHGITPGLEHYAAMADLLGRAGKLEEAYEFISSMHIAPTGSIWSTLLSACRVHKNLELAEKVAKEIFKIDPGNVGAYILMSNMYAAARRWKDAAKMRIFMKKKGIRKEPACSWIEVKNRVHTFISGDKSHPLYDRIFKALKDLMERIEREGYIPDTNEVFHDVEEEQKKYLLFSHSERLALAFGIISSPAGTTIRITKNIRVCVDCHTAIKFMSKIVQREIIVRDNSRFHHFKDGECSCRDYW
ncbi:putative pentatricopeptide repeat-containing protein At3g23330 [Durio zibethinus]|uniref:Pentatricopeptide repeat-containing protein At3g23330 n=1 Tax=Durio zibethinus TaxID=66656 RepID=A0A6P5WSR8_DURZI|nr:putative pentatricopeptide repeat-containing protein At3g23330 [Durio zibethinus]XP_022718717.1 putative pentatricopeptide repeat-containing protein At3g23330 [Durio zibethinus]